MNEDRPRTQAEWFGDLALDAFDRGQEALSSGALAEAQRWLERARRIAPDDLSATLALAAILLRRGDRGATGLFETAAERADARDAWFGLAAARHANGEAKAAGAALAQLLSRFVFPVAILAADLFDAIAAGIGAPGWCVVGDDGRLHINRGGGAAAMVSVDGKPLRGETPPVPSRGRVLRVCRGAVDLIGSPIALDRLRAAEGFVDIRDGGLAGWAWLPAFPERDAEIVVRPVVGRGEIRLTASEPAPPGANALARRRGFGITADRLRGWGLLRVMDANGRDLAGSPLDPGADRVSAATLVRAVALRHSLRPSRSRVPPVPPMASLAAASTGPPAHARPAPSRKMAVVIPVFRGLDATLACLESVFATIPPDTRVIVVEDASPEPALSAAVAALAGERRVMLLRHEKNRGFPGSANAGIRAAAALPGGRDVVLLNSDTLVTPGWLERLRACVHAAPEIGTATPFSNDATIVSYPDRGGGNAMPDRRSAERLGALAARANPGLAVDIPTAVGFCLYLRRECLASVGLFREDLFAQGYGEENDFCLRARVLGWRHVAVPGAYVAHVGGQSFGPARESLIARNLDLLERLHPGYHALIAAFDRADPLAEARRRLDFARFAAGRERRGAVVLVTHDSGGGVETVVRRRCAAIRADGFRAILLRPVIDRAVDAPAGERRYIPGLCVLADDSAEAFPNLRYRLPEEFGNLRDLLRRERTVAVEVHHLLGHHPAVLELAESLHRPQDIRVHDYAWLCPRITFIGADRRYCGEPLDTAVCEACVADGGRHIEEEIGVADLRARSARLLASARHVIVPSDDTASRLRRHFPALRSEVVPHENDADGATPRAAPRDPGRRGIRVCVIGGIGVEKGFEVLLACARDSAGRRLNLDFVVVGHTMDDRRLLATGRVFITGPYRDSETDALIRAQAADVAFLPSIWPETWCFTLGHAWRAGLPVMAFDIGAIAERIRRSGNGWVVPLGLPSGAINNALLAARPRTGDEGPANEPINSPVRARSLHV